MNIFKERRQKFFNPLREDSVAVFFSKEAPVTSLDDRYYYIVDKNFYYLTGLERENFILTIEKINGKYEEYLFIEKPNEDIEKWTGIKMRAKEAKEISGVEHVRYIDDFNAYLNSIFTKMYIKNLYVDYQITSYKDTSTFEHKFTDEILEKYPYVSIKNSNSFLSSLRMIKDDKEISELESAIEITRNSLNKLIKDIPHLEYEYQIESSFQHYSKMQGSPYNSFSTIAASGKNAVVLHYLENKNSLESGELVLLDLGATFNNYCADISRTYPISGKFTDRQKEIYQIVLDSQNEVIREIKPGLRFKDLNEIAKKSLYKGLGKIGMINDIEELDRYYYHGVSHYLGLDTHDVGDRDIVLEPGMVLTVEPGLYIKEESIGIRIEDNILVTEDGHRNLSYRIPKEINEIEELMK